MLNRMKRAVVESYIGAVALGYLLATVVLSFARIFAAPVSAWVAETQYHGVLPNMAAPHFTFENSYPELVSFVLSLLVWYLLLRWLYMTPGRDEKVEAAAESR